MPDWIRIRGARQNNLKNIDVAIPKLQLVVITGPSGAGKSSLAFDTLYAEGHRRYVESLSPSARQFLTQLEKPDVDAVEGLSPAIAVEQRMGAPNPRSTVGTVSDIYDYLRLLFARVSTPVCWRDGTPMLGHTVQQIVDAVLARAGGKPADEKAAEGKGRRVMILAPQTYDPALDWNALLQSMRREGFARIRLDGQVHALEDAVPEPKARTEHTLQVVVDRLSLRGDRPRDTRDGAGGSDKQRLTEAVELGLAHSHGLVQVVFMGDGGDEEVTYSNTPRCTQCGVTYPEPHPRLFSFNSPHGACPTCHGLGTELSVSRPLVVPDPKKCLAEGAIVPWEKKASLAFHQMIEQVAQHYGFSIFTPFGELTPQHREILLMGSGDDVLEFTYEGDDSSHRYSRPFEGVIPNLERRFRETESTGVREEIRQYMSELTCRGCDGQRLRPESLNFRIGGVSISHVTRLSLAAAQGWIDGLQLGPEHAKIAERIVEDVRSRLGFLQNVGLHYLSLDRPMDTLSSGESQRIRLATQIGSALSGVIYILDEPTIGLHPRDTGRLLSTLTALRDTGNTVVVVEHDKDAMLQADYLIEIGPAAGESGGQLVAVGTPSEIMRNPRSATGQYLSGARSIPVPAKRRPPTWQKLELLGATGNNLKDVSVEVPLGLFVCVTGVSGSGKSTLILDTLYPALRSQLDHTPNHGQPYKALKGAEYVERVIHIDQTAIGKSARSNPGTYLGVFSLIRDQFAATPEARARGYTSRRFSFNVEGGRCEACQGEGNKRIEMHFLPDVFVKCDVCGGTRYNRETLEIRYRGHTIADILTMTASEVELFFRAIPAVRTRLTPLLNVGLGYLRLGQPADTLSGGEAQRLKIARELGRRDAGRTLYLMDEPTTGLHVEDVERLLHVLNQLVAAGNSVVVIEHHPEMIKCADYVIDLGPDGGDQGGALVFQGSPEGLIKAENSFTGKHLAEYLTAPSTPGRRGGRAEGKILA
jgi:excinuclease ABC subunit A